MTNNIAKDYILRSEGMSFGTLGGYWLLNSSEYYVLDTELKLAS